MICHASYVRTATADVWSNIMFRFFFILPSCYYLFFLLSCQRMRLLPPCILTSFISTTFPGFFTPLFLLIIISSAPSAASCWTPVDKNIRQSQLELRVFFEMHYWCSYFNLGHPSNTLRIDELYSLILVSQSATGVSQFAWLESVWAVTLILCINWI